MHPSRYTIRQDRVQLNLTKSTTFLESVVDTIDITKWTEDIISCKFCFNFHHELAASNLSHVSSSKRHPPRSSVVCRNNPPLQQWAEIANVALDRVPETHSVFGPPTPFVPILLGNTSLSQRFPINRHHRRRHHGSLSSILFDTQIPELPHHSLRKIR